MTTGGVNSRIGAGLGKQMFDDEAQALIETAHLYGKKVAVHAHGADGINLALKHGADSIEHGTLLDDESVKLFLKSGAYYVPTLSTVNGYLERHRQGSERVSARGAREDRVAHPDHGQGARARLSARREDRVRHRRRRVEARPQCRRVRADGEARHAAGRGDQGRDAQRRRPARHRCGGRLDRAGQARRPDRRRAAIRSATSRCSSACRS